MQESGYKSDLSPTAKHPESADEDEDAKEEDFSSSSSSKKVFRNKVKNTSS